MSIITLLAFVVALDGHRTGYEKNKEMWYGTIICLVVTFLLMSLYTALSSNILISDLFMVFLIYNLKIGEYFFLGTRYNPLSLKKRNSLVKGIAFFNVILSNTNV